jgi:CelD/BcsL family acetyltransferase involved in cellulose biosynthesis
MNANPVENKLEVKRITSSAELNALEPAWSALIADIPSAPLFLTWEWTSTWHACYKNDGALWLLAVYDKGGELRGLIPWMLKQDNNPFGLRRLKFLFYRPPSHMDVLARPADMQAVLDALLEYLVQHQTEWDLLDLRGMAEGSPLKDRLFFYSGYCRERDGLKNLYVSLPNDWEVFEKENLSANRRQQVRRYQRRLEKDFPGQVEYSQITDAAQIAPALDALIENNRRKWDGKEGISSFEDPRFRSFHHAIAAQAFKRGWLRFFNLKVRGKVISSRYCFFYKDVYIDYQLSFDKDWSNYHPGELMLAYVLKEAIREGARELDFLPGVYRWKQSWATGSRQESHLVFGMNLRSRSWQILTAMADRARAAGREYVPSETRQKLTLYLSQVRSRGGAASR